MAAVLAWAHGLPSESPTGLFWPPAPPAKAPGVAAGVADMKTGLAETLLLLDGAGCLGKHFARPVRQRCTARML